MYRSIVAGTDGSATAFEAVRHASSLATSFDARLTLVSAYRPVNTATVLALSNVAGGLAVDTAQVVEEQQHDAEEVLEHAVMSLGAAGARARTVALPGHPAEVLLSVAAREEADLIVVGNRGMQGAARFLLGSVPDRVAHHSGCSVLIVHTC